MLITSPYFVETVVWKRATIEGVERYWCNTYQHVSAEPLTDGTADVMQNNIMTGEQFMYAADVEMFGSICWQWSPLEPLAERSKIFVRKASAFGNKSRPAEDPLIPWEYALMYVKEAETGRSGRMAYRRLLTASEVVPYKDDGLAIPNDKPWGIFGTDLVTYWLNETPLQYAIFKRENELSCPTSYRPVNSVKLGSLVKLQSIEDAQARKTFRAAPYEQAWRESLPMVFRNIRRVETLSHTHPDGITKEDAEELPVMAGELKGVFEFLSEYWSEGVKPVLQLNWRPTAGLDPYSLNVQALVTNAVGSVDEFADIIESIQAYPGDRVPYEFVLPFIVAYQWYALLLDRIGVMRWTGTPIRGLPHVY